MAKTILILAGFGILLLFVPSLLPLAGLLLFAVVFITIVWGFFFGIPALLSRVIPNGTLRAITFAVLIFVMALIVSVLMPILAPLLQGFFTTLTCSLGPVSNACLR